MPLVERLSYIHGFIGGMVWGVIERESSQRIILCARPDSQAEAIINRYVNAHPERSREDMVGLAWDALVLECRAR